MDKTVQDRIRDVLEQYVYSRCADEDQALELIWDLLVPLQHLFEDLANEEAE